ncbi:hypothetical protein BDM02DRAFT_938105 [Thelephora ganbajun]|uniref:Uncharacterized protein n=1 Tax=Thelephora ganbajun TaxID=370292 RepID=A0ACB6Z4R6_THEGA|nr:hypothetical protein BDM02DRAFT_938105 [Thelephora ganbajun]
MASAADIRSVLSVPDPTPGSSQQPQKKPTATSKRPQGISRELYELIGDSVPSVVPQHSKARLKLKPNLGSGPPRSRWEWREFKNGARTDKLRLNHWVKAGTDPDAVYRFEHYNVVSNPYKYTDEEYAQLLEDPEWSREETDYLFKMIEDYDSRFLIVHDRYEFPGGVPRLLEDLKDRYYSICRKLVRSRPWNGDEVSRAKVLGLLSFEKERELTRKQYLRSLESRTPEQIAEEEALYLELKRLEQTERQFKKDRDDLLRTLLGVESGLSDIQLGDDSSLHGLSSMPEIKKSKKKTGSTMEIDSPSVATPSSSIMQAQKRIQTVKSAAYDAQHCITRTDVPQITATKSSHQAATLRSYKLPTPKQAMATKVAQTLLEYGVNSSRLVMPTRENLLHLESLIDATTLLLEAKKNVDRVEQDIRLMKAKVLRRDEQLGGGEGGEAPMDVDQEAVADDDDAGIQPGRGARKKNARRSMSVSSVDAAAQPGRSNKRQKQG